MTPPTRDTPRSFTTPRLDVRWQAGLASFFESFRAAIGGPRASRGFNPAFSFFHLRLSPGRVPARGIAGSLLWHVALLAAIIPLGRLAEPAPEFTLPQIQITWYGPATDVAPVPAAKKAASKPSLRPSPKAKQAVLARAYNSKTTVIFQPPHATNTRQVLIEPDAPPTPPKLLPAMPNIIAWAASPIRPQIAVNANELVARKPRNGSVADAMAPKVANVPPPASRVNVGDNPDAPPAPPVPPATGAIRAERKQPAPQDTAAPTVTYAANRLVALSLAPGEAPPPPANASAPISIGPRAGKPASSAAPNIAVDAVPGVSGTPGANGATPGPAGLLIANEGASPAPVPAPRAPAPLPHIAAPSPIVPRRAVRTAAGGGGIAPHDLAHEVLGMRPIQTLLMSMPNLTSATGSWVLNFAELPGEKIPLDGAVVAPLPLRKVDPEYPPNLIQEGVEGEVVLYAVIGSDGTVSHIRVVQSLDPVLDRNAETAFAKWKFQPALVDKEPIDLEVLVHVPFHYKSPQ